MQKVKRITPLYTNDILCFKIKKRQKEKVVNKCFTLCIFTSFQR